ncbi:glutathione S-transferase C-terminal domain-containing protein [Brachybacterium sp. EF45031]|uniref:glutathione S-transferase family protein n=1 Tax=Brachybacterium sillae TaxID=2810536 RepID=UPI00217E2F25|nr:glutathione S-transferase C-terminal domain-containing protein [Brachybacterium sillae]MCS6710529.1 glutathione S-transferase C-terminal domain-containing protein [Brachybacterium sillae]
MTASSPTPADSSPTTPEGQQDTQYDQKGSYVHKGEDYQRDMNYIADRITRDGRDGWPVEAGRYRLIAARACPWANRTLISRRLHGLEDVLSVGMPGPTHDKRSWTFDLDPDGKDPVLGYERLQQAYFARYPDYPRGITVPAIVDVPSKAVVTNDFQTITLDFATEWTEFHRPGAPDLYPEELRGQIDELNRWMLHEVNNGVYKTGFAGTQAGYEKAYDALWSALDVLEERLSTQRYLFGSRLTESDVRLFPTLVRFDAVYYSHFKCNRQPLFTMPNLWNYTKDLFQTPGFGDTVDFEQIKQHYYVVQTDINPTQVVPRGPDLERFMEPHDRDRFDTDTWGPGGTAPEPPKAEEVVDPDHTPLHLTGR